VAFAAAALAAAPAWRAMLLLADSLRQRIHEFCGHPFGQARHDSLPVQPECRWHTSLLAIRAGRSWRSSQLRA
jgi:hypothetical protein